MRSKQQVHIETLSLDQAIIEASRCLVCHDAPCEQACPAGVRVSTFIRRMRFGDFGGALRKIIQSNILAATCGMTCPRGELCEEACLLNAIGSGIRIRDLQLAAYRFGKDGLLPSTETRVRGRVAIIGSGPAGIACAYALKRVGIEPVVFEKRDEVGGLLTSAIPSHRLLRAIVREEITYALRGVRVNKGIDPSQVTFDHLKSEFDAIFLATGLWQEVSIPVEGAELASDGFTLLASLAKGEAPLPLKGRIAVIGGGNTACDVATCLKLEGASDVTVFYRRSRADMPAFAHEVAEALLNGVRFEFNVSPLRIAAEGGRRRLDFVRTKPGKPDASGRATPVAIPGSEFSVEVDHVVLATGRSADSTWLETNFGLRLTDGRLKVDDQT
ncbi:MAG TPA: dihydropyrimidine dehydrogenase, partial [Firmicutes bacterium]|nr:dihydropyrimidine dehydrogenase [Bacillota bacterium]